MWLAWGFTGEHPFSAELGVGRPGSETDKSSLVPNALATAVVSGTLGSYQRRPVQRVWHQTPSVDTLGAWDIAALPVLRRMMFDAGARLACHRTAASHARCAISS